jgi:hypothetical protein
MNVELSEQLYAMKDDKFDSFIDLLKVFKGNSRQLDILIRLGFFSEFGKTLKLLKIAEIYSTYNGKKVLKKDKLNLPLALVQKYAVKETDKQFRLELEGMDALLREFIELIPDEDIPLRTRLEAQMEYLGYLDYVVPTAKNKGFVLNVDTKYSPKISLYTFSDGRTVTYKLGKAAYTKNPFNKGDILEFRTEEKQQTRKIDGEWVKLDTTETWISNYAIRQNI